MTFTHTPPKIIPTWLFVSSLIVLYDAAYILLRPHTLPGGSLTHLWSGHVFYGTIDHVYGTSAFLEQDGFPASQSWMNLLESGMNLVYVAHWYASDVGPGTLLLGFSAVLMTLAKTMLYLLSEGCSGWRHVAHNDLRTLVLYYFIPSGFWIVMPALCAAWFAREIVRGVNAGVPAEKKKD